VARHDIERYYATGQATPDLLTWPHHLGAPVIDGDGEVGNYNLEGGDQPAVWGDQTLWWVMNDVGNVHTESETPPLGLEVQVTAFGVAQGPAALQQATFYRYRVINRSDARLDSAYVGFYSDVELGDATDDYVGTDTSLSLGYWYNADNQDGTGQDGTYGTGPPAGGVQLLATPTGLPNGRDDDHDGEVDEPGEELGLSYTFCHAKNQGWPFTEPSNGRERYFCLQGRWLDGTPITEGGIGIGSPGPLSRYLFPADPVEDEFWSEPCPNQPCGPANQPFDHRLGVSSGPFDLGPGDEVTFYLAILFAQGADNLDSITELRRAGIVSRNAHEGGYLDPRPVPGAPGADLPSRIGLHRPAPNPVTGSALIRYTLPGRAGVRIAVSDVLGREIAVLTEGATEPGPHAVTLNGSELTPGVYVVRLWVDGQQAASVPVTVLR
jgi:hypothetical protein